MHPRARTLCALLLSAITGGCLLSRPAPSAKGSYDERWVAAGASFEGAERRGNAPTAPASRAEAVARNEAQTRPEQATEGSAEVWRIGSPHPTAPHVEAAFNDGSWRPMPGYTFRDQQELTVRWVPGLRHRDEPDLVAGEIEGEWVAAPVASSDSRADDDEPAAAVNRRDRNAEKHFFPFARALSNPWFAGGRFHRAAPNPTESLDRVLALKTGGIEELAIAQERYVDVAFDEKLAWDLQSGISATPEEIALLSESFVAALLDDQETLLDNVVEAIGDLPERRRRIDRDMVDGHAAACRATRGLADIWGEHLVDVARRLAGTQTLRRGLECMVVLSPDPREGGLAVVNATGKRLRDVTLSIESALGGPKAGFREYYVHLDDFGQGQRLVLPIDLVLAVFDQLPTSRFRGTLTYSVWAREGRIEGETVSLPREAYERFRTNAARPRELVLERAE